jgi:hypothetical protein
VMPPAVPTTPAIAPTPSSSKSSAGEVTILLSLGVAADPRSGLRSRHVDGRRRRCPPRTPWRGWSSPANASTALSHVPLWVCDEIAVCRHSRRAACRLEDSEQVVQPEASPALHGDSGQLEHLSDLAFSQAAEIGKLDHSSLFWWQFLERVAHLPQIAAERDHGFGQPGRGYWLRNRLRGCHRPACGGASRSLGCAQRSTPIGGRYRAPRHSGWRRATAKETPPARRPRPSPADHRSERRARMRRPHGGRRSLQPHAARRRRRDASSPRRRGNADHRDLRGSPTGQHRGHRKSSR